MNDNNMHILPGQPRDKRAVAHIRPGLLVLRCPLDPENRAAAIERDRIYGAKACGAGGLAGAGAQRGRDTAAGEAEGNGVGADANQGAGVKS